MFLFLWNKHEKTSCACAAVVTMTVQTKTRVWTESEIRRKDGCERRLLTVHIACSHVRPSYGHTGPLNSLVKSPPADSIINPPSSSSLSWACVAAADKRSGDKRKHKL